MCVCGNLGKSLMALSVLGGDICTLLHLYLY